MPYLRCSVCEREVFETSLLALGSECLECEEGEMLEVDEDLEDRDAPATTEPSRPHLAVPRAAARKLLADQGIDDPPIPVEQLARRMGLTVIERRSLGSLSGRLVDTTIEVAPSSSNRRRFVVAHELGHHVLKRPHGSSPTVEAEVNAFAGELLVPGHLLQQATRKTTDLGDLARRFEVSRQVLEIAARVHRLCGRID
jgi:hypothetical protein